MYRYMVPCIAVLLASGASAKSPDNLLSRPIDLGETMTVENAEGDPETVQTEDEGMD